MVKVLRPLRSVADCQLSLAAILCGSALTLNANMDVVLGLFPWISSVVVGLREGV